MILDWLRQWPPELFTLWLVPLFFGSKFIELGNLGLFGRGMPLTSSRNRLSGAPAAVVAAVLVGTGYAVWATFGCWLYAIAARVAW